MVSLEMWRWLGMVAASGLWLWLHLWLAVRTASAHALTPAQRLSALLLPPLTPVYGYHLGLRGRSLLWWALLVVYGGLWSLR